MFKIIDRNNWTRKPYFDHFFDKVPCTYSVTVNIEISELSDSRQNIKLSSILFLFMPYQKR